MAFYLRDYRKLLFKLLKLKNHCWITMTEAKSLKDNKSPLFKKAIIMRHDVDRFPKYALKMAELESSLNVKATYYFRCNSKGQFPKLFIKKINKLGHEVGYHYECLSYCKGNKKKALTLFHKNLINLRKSAICTSVAMHGAPLSKYNNEDLLVGINLKLFKLSADATLSFRNTDLVYLTDTGGKWNSSDKNNLRDYVGKSDKNFISPTNKYFATWVNKLKKPIIISTHPERWANNNLDFILAEIRDRVANFIKKLLYLLRRTH